MKIRILLAAVTLTTLGALCTGCHTTGTGTGGTGNDYQVDSGSRSSTVYESNSPLNNTQNGTGALNDGTGNAGVGIGSGFGSGSTGTGR
jgi:hypothetical protein